MKQFSLVMHAKQLNKLQETPRNCLANIHVITKNYRTAKKPEVAN